MNSGSEPGKQEERPATRADAAELARFWRGGLGDGIPLRPIAPPGQPPALQLLGPLPFARGFPLMGFFASVYEHVSKTAGGE